MSVPDNPSPSAQPVPQALPGANTALALLLAINLFNFMDRQVLASVEPEISKEILHPVFGEAHEKFWSGVLAFGFLVTYMIIAPVFAWLSEQKVPRWAIICFGVVLWSLASGGSGLNWVNLLGVHLATAFWLLFITRCLVGFGEGAYGPVAPTMLADYYPVEKRGKVMSMFYLAIPVGGALGYTLGDVVANKIPGLDWRWAFYLVIPPGLLLGAFCLFMKEPPRGQTEVLPEKDLPRPGPQIMASPVETGIKPADWHITKEPPPGQAQTGFEPATDKPASQKPPPNPMNPTTAVSPRKAKWNDYADLFRIPSYVINLAGMTCLMFSIGAIAYWMPRYLDQRGADDVLGMGPRTFFGLLTAAGGLIATIAGGMAGDALRKKIPGSYFLVSGIAMIAGFPMILLALWTPFPWAWLFIFLGVFALFFNTAPTNTINANVTHPSVRATAFAVNILVTHLFGDAVSPAIVGLIAGEDRLDRGFMVVSLLMLVGGAFWIWGTVYLKRDTDAAPMRLRKMEPVSLRDMQ
jgi:MFS family permease